MDFRTCPACQASVLEDDAVECPFCGASMSGKPQPGAPKKPASRPAASSSPTASKPATPPPPPSKPIMTPGAARRAGRSTAPADVDDPFEVDATAVRRAVKLAPRPIKTRTYEITCPMCETKGYAEPQHAGKDVHCANPQCLQPVFKSPRPQVVEKKEEKPRPPVWLYASAGGGALIVLAAVVWFVLRDGEGNQTANDGPVVAPTTEILPGAYVPEENVVVQREKKLPRNADELRREILAQIGDRALQRKQNRSVEYGLQLAAEANAEGGRVKVAQDQVKRLQAIAKAQTYFQVQPLVEIGWRQLAAGETAEAQKTAQAALQKAKDMPRSIRKTLDAASALGALLVALDQLDEAQKLLDAEQDFTTRGESSLLWRAAVDGKTFDVDAELRRPWRLAAPEPMRMAIVETLVGQGRANQAWAFAKASSDVASQDACRAAAAGRLVLSRKSDADAVIEGWLADAKLTPAGRCRLWSAVAAAHQSLQADGPAQAARVKAEAAYSEIRDQPALPLPNRKQVYDGEGRPFAGLTNPAPRRSAALAAADLARVQWAAGDRDAAWTTWRRALLLPQSSAPSTAETERALEECQKSEGLVIDDLAAQLKLGRDESKRRPAFNRYRSQLNRVHAEASNRLQLQIAILRDAAQAGLWNESWTWAVERSQASELKERDLFLTSPFAGWAKAQAVNQAELAARIAADAPEARANPLDVLAVKVETAVAGDNWLSASEELRGAYRGNLAKQQLDRIDQLTWSALGRIADRPAEEVLSFIRQVHHPVTREDACYLFAGLTSLRGKGPQLYRTATDAHDLETLEVVSIYRGIIAAIGAPVAKPATPAPANAQSATAIK